tara:strand:+ start:565 stop:711 length:147 start_codon:yes stop_codon:yes gene_type:complete
LTVRGTKYIFNQNLRYYAFYIEKLFIRYCFIGRHFSFATKLLLAVFEA